MATIGIVALIVLIAARVNKDTKNEARRSGIARENGITWD